MARCKRIFSLGMAHVQAVILALPYSVDSMMWNIILEIIQGEHQGGGSDHHVDALDPENIKRLKGIITGLGRFASLFVIQKVNCKFLLLGVTMAEVVFLVFAHSLYIAYGSLVLAWTYSVVIFIQGTRFPFSINILSKWTLTRRMTALYCIFEVTKSALLSIMMQLIDVLARKYHSTILLNIYSTVAMKLVFCVVWTIFGAADPMQSLFVSVEELSELRKGNPRRVKTHWKNTVPWRNIFATPILYGCIVYDVGNFWSTEWEYSGLIDPFFRYMESGTVVALVGFYIILLLSLINGFIVDFIIKLGITTVNNIRKTTAAISSWGCGVCFLLIGYTLTSESSANQIWVAFFQLFKISNFKNDSAMIVYALSPNYVGFNYGFVSGVAYLTLSLKERVEYALKGIGMEWVLYFYCMLMIFSCLTMLLSGDCHPRDFDSFGTVEWKDESFVSFP